MIKNIVFDLGGVLLDIDHELTYSKLSEVMGVEINAKNIPAHLFKIMLGYEKGEINTETFLWNLQKESAKLTPQPDKLIKAWNAMLIGWNPARFAFLETLKGKYALYLLSNSNDLHNEWVQKDLKKNHDIIDFEDRFFKGIYYSHLLKMRKPENKIFKSVIEDAGILPEETLYIDDVEENVAKAKEAGLFAILHDPNTEIIDVFNDYLTNCDT